MIETVPTEKTLRHLTRLAVEIGSRPVGSAANHAAAGYIASVFQSLGMMPEMLRFDTPVWKHTGTQIRMDNGEPLTGLANTFSPPCEVHAPLAAAGTLSTLESSLITDRVLLLYGALSSEMLWPKNNPIYLPESHIRLFDLLERGKPAAVLFVSPRQNDLSPMLEDADFEIPSATISPESGLQLIGKVGETISVQIESTRQFGYGDHVIARQPGRGKQVVVVCAHFDSKVNTPGAWDNASGTAALLGVAERLLGRWMNVWVEYAAFNNEEYYGSSDSLNHCYDRYMTQHGDLSNVIAAINIDGVGQAIGTNTYTVLGGSDAFGGLVDGMSQQFPAMQRVDPWVESVHSLYVQRGVPSVALTTRGVASLHHSAGDDATWISGEKLDEVSAFVVRLIESIADKSATWSRPNGSSG